jgi:hypothetical protein
MGCSVFPDDDVASGELINLAQKRVEPWGKHDFIVEDENAA